MTQVLKTYSSLTGTLGNYLVYIPKIQRNSGNFFFFNFAPTLPEVSKFINQQTL